MEICFSKYQATGNDFVLIDGLKSGISLSESQVKKICDRHFGVGADGLIIVRPSKVAQFFMDYYNADGSKAEMCGNGIRCAADFILDNKFAEGSKLKIETRGGTKYINISGNIFAVNMGAPSYDSGDIGFKGRGPMWKYALKVAPIYRGHPERKRKISGPMVNQKIEAYGVSIGNPHCVILSGDLDAEPVETLGPVIENNPIFARRINVEWVNVKTEKELEVKVWERGSGLTLACGTGACAAFAVINRLGLVGKKADVSLPGGKVTVELLNDNLVLKGGAARIFSGKIRI